MKIIGIYAIVTPNDRVYIGSSIDVRRRWKQHRAALAGGRHENFLLQRAYDKHDACMLFVLLEECLREDMYAREQHYMDTIGKDRLYNLLPRAGAGGLVGYAPSEITLARLRAARVGRLHSEETKRRIGDAHRGRTLPPDQVERMRASKIGRPTKRAIGKSGYKGVVFSQGKWVARVTPPTGGTKHLGRFCTPELAYAMRLVWLASVTV